MVSSFSWSAFLLVLQLVRLPRRVALGHHPLPTPSTGELGDRRAQDIDVLDCTGKRFKFANALPISSPSLRNASISRIQSVHYSEFNLGRQLELLQIPPEREWSKSACLSIIHSASDRNTYSHIERSTGGLV